MSSNDMILYLKEGDRVRLHVPGHVDHGEEGVVEDVDSKGAHVRLADNSVEWFQLYKLEPTEISSRAYVYFRVAELGVNGNQDG